MKGLTDVFGVMMVEIVVVPVAVAAMMTTIRASLPDPPACAKGVVPVESDEERPDRGALN